MHSHLDDANPGGPAASGEPLRQVALGRAQERAPGHVDVEEILERCRRLRDGAIRERERTARRRTLRVVAAAALAVAAVTATAFTVVLDGRRREAERARAEAEDLAGFMLFDLNERLAAAGRLDILADVARRAKRYFEDATAGPRRNHVVALSNVAEVLRLEGDLAGAASALESALAMARRLRGEDPAAPVREVAASLLSPGGARATALAPALAEDQARFEARRAESGDR